MHHQPKQLRAAARFAALFIGLLLTGVFHFAAAQDKTRGLTADEYKKVKSFQITDPENDTYVKFEVTGTGAQGSAEGVYFTDKVYNLVTGTPIYVVNQTVVYTKQSKLYVPDRPPVTHLCGFFRRHSIWFSANPNSHST